VWWLPLLGLLVGAAAAVGVTALQTESYESTTTLRIVATDEDLSQPQAAQGAQQRVPSYIRLLQGSDLAERVATDLGLVESPAQLQERIDARAVADTALIDVRVSGPDAAEVQQIAESVGNQFPELVAGLGGGADAPFEVTVTEPPNRPTTPASPDPMRNLAVGLLAGLLVGLGLAYARAASERSVIVDDHVSGPLGAPVLGRIPARHKDEPALLERGATGSSAEAFRQIRNNLQWLDGDRTPRVLVLASAVPDDDVPALAVNLGLALADVGNRVALVVADLRSQWDVDTVMSPEDTGLSDVLAGRAQLDTVLRRYEDRDLWVLPPGTPPPDPGDVVASRPIRDLVDKLRGDFDQVLIVVPPALEFSDATGLAGHTDGVLLVVRHGRTRPDEVRQAGHVLSLGGARVLGAVVAGAPHREKERAPRRVATAKS
jgi:receptor protein-tyrosine kinase